MPDSIEFTNEQLNRLMEDIKASSLYEDLVRSLNNKTEESAEIVKRLKELDHPNALEVECIHCSTGFNANDHFFIPKELYAARDTPINQIADWMHDRDQIIGCISASQVKDFDGEDISFDEDADIDITEKFDLHTTIIVWAREFRDYATDILKKFEDDGLFVSMECTFDDYDFALKKNGKVTIIARNENTDFLSKHLRQFGGNGEYQGYRVGIAFRDIKFTGVGFVDNPANKRSDVTDVNANNKGKKEENEKNVKKNKKNSDAGDSLGVTKSAAAICEDKGENRMEFEKLYNEEKVKAEELEKEVKVLKDQSEASEKESGDKIEALDAEVAELKADASEVRTYSRKDGGEVEYAYVTTNWDGEEVKVTENTVYTSESVTTVTEDLIAAVASANEKLVEAEAKLSAIEVEKKNDERKAAIADLDVGEVSDEELFAMSDETYEAMVKFAPAKKEESEDQGDENKDDDSTDEDKDDDADAGDDSEDKPDEDKDDDAEDTDAADSATEDLDDAEASDDDDDVDNSADAAALESKIVKKQIGLLLQ